MSNNDMDTAQIIKLASEVAAKTALETVEKEQKKAAAAWHNKRLYNTKLLLKNYRPLKLHIKNALFEQDKIDSYMKESAQDIIDLMWQTTDSDVIVESIKQSAQRTRIIMAHIDGMLELYKAYCEKSTKPEKLRQYHVIEAMYIKGDEERQMEDVATELGVGKRQGYRDVDAAVETLSALIFGINGLSRPKNKMSKTCH